jgi:hypothetical protein
MPFSDLSNTWLLLRITGLGMSVLVQRLPSVPMQQNFAPTSVAFPPEVPSLMGADWAEAVSLGKTWPGTGVGVGAGVLEPPPQPIAAIRRMDPIKMPAILAMAINLFRKTGDAEGEKRLRKFYAVGWPVNQSNGTSVTLDAESLPGGWTFVNI